MSKNPNQTFWSKLVSAGWLNPAGVTAAIAGAPFIVGYPFMAGHLVTDTASAPGKWSVLPGVPAAIPIGIVSAFWLFIIIATFFYSGLVARNAPLEEDKNRQILAFDRPRFWLFATLVGSLIVWGIVSFISFQAFHRSLTPWLLVLIPAAGLAAGLASAAQAHGWKVAMRAYAFRFAGSTCYWIITACSIVQVSSAIATEHKWNWNSNFLPWEYLILLLLGSAFAALLAAHRRVILASATSVFLTMMVASLDPKDFFAVPFRLLHLS